MSTYFRRISAACAPLSLGSVIPFILLLILAAPSIVSYRPYELAWDDTYLFHRAVCLHNAVYGLDLAGMKDCYSILSKSPILTFMTLPWGRAASGEAAIPLALIALAILIWILVLLIYRVAISAGAALWTLPVAGIAIWLNPLLGIYGGFFLADILIAWCTALLLLLIPLELRTQPSSARMDVARGALWGLVIVVGTLAKATFFFFLAPTALAVIWIRFRRLGLRSCLRAALTAVVCSLPAIVVWAVFWRNFLGHAMQATIGGYSKFYAVAGQTPFVYLRGYVAACRWGLLPTSALLLYFLWKIRRAGALWFRLLPLALILSFLAICSFIPYDDYRYAMPVMIALPFALAVVPRPGGEQTPLPAAAFAFGLLACVLSTIPLLGRTDMAYLRYAEAVMDKIARPGTKIMLATETAGLNIETLLLVKELGGNRLHSVMFDTLYYDALQGRSVYDSYHRMEWADYILFDKPPLPHELKWNNEFANEFYQYAVGMADEDNSAPHEYMHVLKVRPPAARNTASTQNPQITAVTTDPAPPPPGLFRWTLTGASFTPGSRVTITGRFCESGCELNSQSFSYKAPTELTGVADLTNGSGSYQFQVFNGSLASNAATIEIKRR
jgi:hypothetical protein